MTANNNMADWHVCACAQHTHDWYMTALTKGLDAQISQSGIRHN